MQVQCRLADRSRDLILEITALRSKLAQLRDEKLTQEIDIRDKVKRGYDDLVYALFSTSFSLKNRFEEYRRTLYHDVVDSLFEIRTVRYLFLVCLCSLPVFV